MTQGENPSFNHTQYEQAQRLDREQSQRIAELQGMVEGYRINIAQVRQEKRDDEMMLHRVNYRLRRDGIYPELSRQITNLLGGNAPADVVRAADVAAIADEAEAAGDHRFDPSAMDAGMCAYCLEPHRRCRGWGGGDDEPLERN